MIAPQSADIDNICPGPLRYSEKRRPVHDDAEYLAA